MAVSVQLHAAVALAAGKGIKEVRLSGTSDRSVVGSDKSDFCVYRESNPRSLAVLPAA